MHWIPVYLRNYLVTTSQRTERCFFWEPGQGFNFLLKLECNMKYVVCEEIFFFFFLPSQGDIVSCAGTYIHVWSINGNPIVSVNTFTGRSQQIVCCCVSEMNEWDTQNVIVTGHSDGVVRVSRMWEKHFRISATLVCLESVKLPTVEGHRAGRSIAQQTLTQTNLCHRVTRLGAHQWVGLFSSH